MVKRISEETARDWQGNIPKRQKITDDFPRTQPEEITSARQLQHLLAFQQDAPAQLKHNVQCFKSFLDSLVRGEDPGFIENRKNILKGYLQIQCLQDEDDSAAVATPDILQTWSYAAKINNDSLLSAVPAVLAILLRAISTSIEFKDLGLRICKTLLKKDQLKLIERGLTANKSKEHLISPCLRLLTEIVSFDGGTVAKNVFAARDTTLKRLDFLLGLRRLASEDAVEDKRKPSVRSNALRYLLANIKFQDPKAKSEILSHGKLVRVAFQDLRDDPAQLIFDVLNTFKQHVLLDNKVARNVISRVFSDWVLGRIATLYSYEDDLSEENNSMDRVDITAHKFLIFVCSTPGIGVLSPHTSWYPPGIDPVGVQPLTDTASDSIDLGLDSIGWFNKFTSKVPVRNTTLASFAQTLRPWANILQTELLLSIFKAAPELVADYFFKKKTFSFDPKLTSTWMGYSAFLFSAIQLPTPEYCGRESGFAWLPPPVSLTIESILPQPLTQQTLTKCLHQKESLITFFALRIIVVAFEKLKSVLEQFHRAADEQSALWKNARDSLLLEFCRRCPNMKEVITVFRNTPDDNLLQRETVTRLLGLYYQMVPRIALEERFDVSIVLTKALTSFDSPNPTDNDSGMRLLILEHLILIAQCSPNMRWWHKPEALNFSPFTTILRLLVQSPIDVRLKQITSLLRTVIYDNELLQQETKISALDALLVSLRHSSDPISQEKVFDFLDNSCVRLVAKPVKYWDDLQERISRKDASNPPTNGPVSLLLVTLTEQWPYAVKAKNGGAASIAKWLAKLFQYLRRIGEDDQVLSTLFQDIVSVEDREIESLMRQTLDDGSSEFELQELVDDEDLRARPTEKNVAGAKLASRITAEDLKWYMESPPKEDQDHLGLNRWMQKDVQDAVEDGLIGDLIMCLCSKHLDIRMQALANLGKCRHKVEASEYVEWQQMSLLIGEVHQTAAECVSLRRFPYFLAIFAARSLLVLADALHFLYPKINIFLNKRPVWDINKVPLLRDILLKPPVEDDGYSKEVDWLLDCLTDGLRTPEDMDSFRVNNVFERFLALYAAPTTSKQLREKILRLAFRATYVQGSTTLITRSGIFSWVESQILLYDAQEQILKALVERLYATCDQDRIEQWAGRPVRDIIDRIAL